MPITLSATLGPDSAVILAEAHALHPCAIAATLGDASASLSLAYNPNVWRGKSALTGVPWDKTADISPRMASPWRDADKIRPLTHVAWQNGATLASATADAWRRIPSRPSAPVMPWGTPPPRSAQIRSEFAQLEKFNGIWSNPWDRLFKLAAETTQRYTVPPAKPHAMNTPWDQAFKRATETRIGYAQPDKKRPIIAIPWGPGGWPEWVIIIIDPPIAPPLDTPGCYTPPGGAAVLLNLSAPPPVNANLNLTCASASATATAQRSYTMINTLSIVRLPERTPLPALSVSLQLDVDSWAWGMTATLADKASLDLVMPGANGPVEIEININGHIWRTLVESYSQSREFANSAAQITGRSPTAWLAAPYAPARSRLEASPYTANQLADSELADTGFTLNWSAPDWQVPGGVYSYEGKTALEAIATVAGAAGYIIQPAMASRALTIQPRYPASPWDWNSTLPNATLPESMIFKSSLKWEPKPEYNAVWIAGQSQGVMVNVKRSGSAGTLAAPMVVDPLITDVPAGRERGRNLLADTGKQASISLELPLFATAPGLLTPGKLVEVQTTAGNWRGQVMSVSLNAAWNDTLDITQSIEIERHY